MKRLGYKVYTEPLRINIVGVRSPDQQSNKFNDAIIVFWYDKSGKLQSFQSDATTDAGVYWRNTPASNLGTAILKAGQYDYKIGLHKGQYQALVQAKPVTVIRDYNRDTTLDFFNGKEETGNFGINIHRAGSKGRTVEVDKWSAGCQVFADSSDFSRMMTLANQSKNLYGNEFKYSLIDYRAGLKKGRTFIVASFLSLIGVYLLFKNKESLK